MIVTGLIFFAASAIAGIVSWFIISMIFGTKNGGASNMGLIIFVIPAWILLYTIVGTAFLLLFM